MSQTLPMRTTNQHAETHNSEPYVHQIAHRAYCIWCEQGRPHGQDQSHWLEAEKQIAREKWLYGQVAKPVRWPS